MIKKKIIILLVLTLFCLGCKEKNKLGVHFIDVGYGVCILIENEICGNLLIDGGYPEQSDKILNYLKEEEIERLDLVVATHPHPDHIGGLPEVLQNIEVGKLLTNEGMTGRKEWAELRELSSGKNIECVILKRGDIMVDEPDFKIEVLHPEKPGNNLNESALVLKMTHGGVRFLFTADISSRICEELAGLYGDKLKSEVLKAPHHGKQPSRVFFKTVDPSIAVISTGESEWRKPEDEEKVLSILEELGIKVLSTENRGTVVVKSNGRRFKIIK
ncbi:MAG: MBL fold metallo-hydrolase [bacterium]